MPRETLRCLLDLDMPVEFIYGNGEQEVLRWMKGAETSSAPKPYWDLLRWNAQQLQADYQTLFESWPLTRRLQIDGVGEVLFCHATPRNDTEIFTRTTAEARLLPVFKEVDVPVVVCGHTHMQFDRTVGDIRVVNAGSVGMPFQEPGAYWLLLGPGIELRRTDYDLERAAQRVRHSKSPLADDFADRNILEPPSEQKTLEAFAHAELK
jgi:diadenosine tetraphosphatase ApaH/serine/threonine PP2A family protein phosphatase